MTSDALHGNARACQKSCNNVIRLAWAALNPDLIARHQSLRAAEFQRLESLVHASLALSAVVLAVGIASWIYLARRIWSTRKTLQLYPVRMRCRLAFAVGDAWEASVAQAHVEPLRAHRRNGRYLFAALAIWLLLSTGIRAARHHWLERLSAVADEPVVKSKE